MDNAKDRDKKLTRRLRYLWTFELFDSFLFPAFVAWSSWYLQQPVGILAIYSTGLITFLLWQGAAYWWLKLRAHRTGGSIPRRYLAPFRTLREVNWVLIGLLPVIVAVAGGFGLIVRSRLNLIAGAALYALVVLEQVNYYHYQLMYDYGLDWRYLVKRRRLKRASLSRALARARGVGKPDDDTNEQRIGNEPRKEDPGCDRPYLPRRDGDLAGAVCGGHRYGGRHRQH